VLSDGSTSRCRIAATCRPTSACPRAAALDTGVEVVLDRNIEVRGRCVDERGAALPGILVRAPRETGAVATKADGSFAIDGLPETAAYIRVYPGDRPLAARVVRLPFRARERRDLGDIVLATGATLRGRYVDAKGAPVPNARVVLVCRELESGFLGERKSDAEGRFTFDHVAPARWTSASTARNSRSTTRRAPRRTMSRSTAPRSSSARRGA